MKARVDFTIVLKGSIVIQGEDEDSIDGTFWDPNRTPIEDLIDLTLSRSNTRGGYRSLDETHILEPSALEQLAEQGE